jgi:endoglucanase
MFDRGSCILMRAISHTVLCSILILLGIFSNPAYGATNPDSNAYLQNSRLGRGINMADMLEAPTEGAWGVRLDNGYFPIIQKAGFRSVRIPIAFHLHALNTPPYTIDQKFFERVDGAIKTALDCGLAVVIDLHHYGELRAKPEDHRARFLSIWDQIAKHYQSFPDTLYFEPFNEPGERLNPDAWNSILAEVLGQVRQSNPKRTVIIDSPEWASIDGLDKLRLPENDRNLIVSCHYYNPFEFTHQGAVWIGPRADAWLGTSWPKGPDQMKALQNDLDRIQNWSRTNKRPIYIGEFGVYSKADMKSRATWTAYMARQCEKRGFSWAYWEFCSGFGAYDPQAHLWREPLVKALIPNTSNDIVF